MIRPLLMLSVLLAIAPVCPTVLVDGFGDWGQVPVPGSEAAQSRDAASVLTEMRAALGGDAVLDAIKSFTVKGSVRMIFRTGAGNQGPRFARELSIEQAVLLPDHFLEIRRDYYASGPVTVDNTYYRGFTGDTLIKKTVTDVPTPPEPRSPELIMRSQRRSFARLALSLFGRSFSSYELQFSFVGQEQHEGQTFDVVKATAEDGYQMRLWIDAVTHLPAAMAYSERQGVTLTTSSVVAAQGNEVVAREPLAWPAKVNIDNNPIVEYRIALSDFRTEDGITWPHKLTESVAGEVKWEFDLGEYKLNPKLSPKRFDIR